MDRLGHDRYFVHGSSIIGSEIGSSLSAMRPKSIMGLHMSDPYLDVKSSWKYSMRYLWSTFWDAVINDGQVCRVTVQLFHWRVPGSG